MLQRFLRHHRTQGSSPHTLEYYTQALGQYLACLGGAEMDAESLRLFIEKLRSEGKSQATVNNRARAVKAWGNWLVEEEYLPKSPFARVKRPSQDVTAKDIFTPDEVQRLLDSCDRATTVGLRDYAIILLLYSTGLRAAELCALHLSDLNRASQLLLVRRGKGGKFRQVPLGRKVERAIDKYRDSLGETGVTTLFLTRHRTPLTDMALAASLDRRGKALGLHVNPHKFRHSCAVQYLRNGGRVEVLKQMLGHSKLEMTLHYARIAGVDVVQGHDAADPLNALRR